MPSDLSHVFFSAALAGGEFRVEAIGVFTKTHWDETEERADTVSAVTKFSFVHSRNVVWNLVAAHNLISACSPSRRTRGNYVVQVSQGVLALTS